MIITEDVSNHIDLIKTAINDEIETINLYDGILDDSSIPERIKSIIREIDDDEKDHLVLLSALLEDEVEDEYPDYGDEDNMEISEE